MAIKLVFHVSLIFKKVRRSGGVLIRRECLFDIMVLGVRAYLGEGANNSILALIQGNEICLQLETSKFVISHPLT